MTIEQIQAAIDAKADARQIINMIADYIQENPGGGGGLTLYSGDGTLAGNRVVDLDGNSIIFENAGTNYLFIDPVAFQTRLNAEDGTAASQIDFRADLVGSNVYFSLYSTDGSNEVTIEADAIANSITYTADTHTFNGVQAFADNAAAVTGGLAVGTIYRTGDLMKIVHA